MSSKVVVVDYGVGNLRSVSRALEVVGATPEVTSSISAIDNADRLVLPGVGSFPGCARALRDSGLWDAVEENLKKERPVLGICVGMQIMFEHGEEFGRTQGFGTLPGAVDRIATRRPDGSDMRTPFIGWSPLTPASETPWEKTIFEGLEPGSSVYFVHSYAAIPTDASHCLAISDYGAGPVCAAVQLGNVFGVQFHPEKSGPTGLRILENFVRAQD